MDEENKLPLKRVELSLSKFNEVAIPHHLDLLRQHKTNIIKYEECGEYARVRAEQTNARRVAAQLRALLAELDALRRRVAPADRPRFDRLTQRSRDLTLRAIVDYLETSPLSINRQNVESKRESEMVCGSAVSTDSVGVVSHAHEPTPPAQDVTALVDDPLIQLQVEDHEAALQSREAVLRGWSELQAEVRALHDTWQHVQAAALAQRDQVASVADNVEVAAENVETARKNLSLAERLRAGAYGAGGAAAGALVGGPLGLVLGAKVAAAGLLAGSALGYLGARLLGRRRRRQLDDDKRD
ncbi:syntaxin-17 isoform X3 [Galleria mellonella]|uniref:Syntaxin-17 isoform X3 n=1 Tax=Galleria mellonella TaxID=7137 RepID=A0ABM3M8Z2_GALME|nr:syntaxin-17 isoform X3 [Galleria mellonella]